MTTLYVFARDYQYRTSRIAVEKMPNGRWRFECITEVRRPSKTKPGRYEWVRV